MKINKVKKVYGQRVVLDFPETEIIPGRIYAVMGANGSGKSTLARAVALEKSTDAGNVGYMPQKSFAFRMSVRKNAELSGASEDIITSLLSSLELDKLSSQNAKNISGGETAKLALARILGKHFDLLVLDEPTASMDVEGTLISEKLIKEYCKKENAAVILITHSTGQALRISDELLFLRSGILLESGNTESILNYPKTKEAEAFFKL